MKVLYIVLIIIQGLLTSLHADESPQFISTATKNTCREGDAVKLACKVRNIGSHTIEWKRGQTSFSENNGYNETENRIKILPGHTLEITDAAVEDSGDYICEINTYPKPMNQIHHVTVTAPPKIISLSAKDPVIITEGDEITVHCTASGNPTPSISWQKRGLKEKPKEEPYLHLANVNRHHTGLYECRAVNSVGRPAHAAINIRVLHIPYIDVENPWVHAGVDNKAEISCTLHSNPVSNMTWYFKNEPLLSKQNIMNVVSEQKYSLRFKRISEDDFGTYTCSATNELGSTKVDIILSGKPSPAVINSNPDGIYENNFTLSWEVLSYTSLTEYRLTFRKYKGQSSSEPWLDIIVPADSSPIYRHTKFFTITGLDVATVYEVTVSSRNQYGWSESSTAFLFSTWGAEITEANTPELKDEPDDVQTATEAAFHVNNNFSCHMQSIMSSGYTLVPHKIFNIILIYMLANIL